MKKRRSIVWQSAMRSAVLCAVACGGLFVGLFQIQKGIYEQRMIEDAKESIAKVTSFLLGYFYAQGNWIHLVEHQAKLNRTPNTLYSYLVNADGRIDVGVDGLRSPEIGRSVQPWEPPMAVNLTSATERELVAGPELAGRFPGRVRVGDRVALVSAPIVRPSDGEPCAELRVALVQESIRPTLASLRWTLLAVGLLLVGATAGIVFLTTRRKLEPIRDVSRRMHELATQANRIASELAEGRGGMLGEGLGLPPPAAGDAEETRVFRESLTELTAALRRASSLANEARTARSLAELAAQVAHDIRSPLTALAMATEDLHALPESQRQMVRGAVTRIQDIANQLLERDPPVSLGAETAVEEPTETPRVLLLSSLIEALMTEKRMQFRSRLGLTIEATLDASCYGLFVRVEPRELRRALSNLVNNAAEAIEGAGHVRVRLKADGRRVQIAVTDDGRGIPAALVAQLTLRGATYGKPGGKGRGLAHARAALERWGGDMFVDSEVGRGTTVRLTLPQAEAPRWFVDEIQCGAGTTVAIVDDDASIHQVWRERFERAAGGAAAVEFVSFSGPAAFRDWARRRDSSGAMLVLMDHELIGAGETGLAALAGHEEHGILVTSRFEDVGLLARCEAAGVRVLPKAAAAYVPVRIRGGARVDAVLIDDDSLVQQIWLEAADRTGKRLLCFGDAGQFVGAAGGLERTVPVFVDYRLGNGASGLDVARHVTSLGFAEVYLTSGHRFSRGEGLEWLTGVRDKEPPWG